MGSKSPHEILAKGLQSQKLLKYQEMPSDVPKMHEDASRPGLHPGPR